MAVLLCLAGVLAGPLPAGAQTPAAPENPRRALSITYADGRVSTHQVRRSGGMWTPRFPRIAGAATERDGQPLTALDVRHEVEGEAVVATVSLLYGTPHQSRVKVATVPVTSEPVAVAELTAFGVVPITLALIELPDAVVFPPEAVSVSGELELSVVPIAPGATIYRFEITNRSGRPLTALRYVAYRGDVMAISGMRRGRHNLPLLPAGTADTFDVSIGSGGARGRPPGPPEPIDRVAITSVLWADDVAEGDQETAERERAFYAERARGIRLVLAILEQSGGLAAKELHARISEMPVHGEIGIQMVKEDVLTNLARVTGPVPAMPLDQWVAATIADYHQWLARIVGPR